MLEFFALDDAGLFVFEQFVLLLVVGLLADEMFLLFGCMFLEDMTCLIFKFIETEYFDNIGVRNIGVGVLVSHVGWLDVDAEQFVVLFYYFCAPKF